MEVNINSESKTTKVGGIFDRDHKAKAAFDDLKNDGDFVKKSIKLISPHDQHYDQKIEPEDKEIGKTMLKLHLVFAVMGLFVGVVISSLLFLLDFEFLQQHILETYTSISIICAFLGLIIAGAFSLKPDHDHLINEIREATRNGKWAIIVHTDSYKKAEKAKNLMQPYAESTSATL
jgi:uncharacterized protein YacL